MSTKVDWQHAKYLIPLKLFDSLYVMENEHGKQIYDLGMMISTWCLSDDVDLKLMAMRMKFKYDKYLVNIDSVNNMLFSVVILDPKCNLEYVNWMVDQTYDVDKTTFLKNKMNSVLIPMFEAYNTSQTQPNDPSVQYENTSLVNDGGCVSIYLNFMCKRQKEMRD